MSFGALYGDAILSGDRKHPAKRTCVIVSVGLGGEEALGGSGGSLRGLQGARGAAQQSTESLPKLVRHCCEMESERETLSGRGTQRAI